MARSSLDRLRKIALAFPDTEETMTWGEPHFRVKGKIFCGYGKEKGKEVIGFKLEMEHADILVQNDLRFTRAPYVGHKGWVSMDAKGIRDWDEVQTLIEESYRLISSKKKRR
jgi:predicted DNA-binding protein (MmcQ/YjbR family)